MPIMPAKAPAKTTPLSASLAHKGSVKSPLRWFVFVTTTSAALIIKGIAIEADCRLYCTLRLPTALTKRARFDEVEEGASSFSSASS
jgi:hypothetical protein